MSMPMLTASMSFDEASAAVVAFLKTQVPLGLWMVSRYDGSSQLLLEVDDTAYGVGAGTALPWEGSLCHRMVAGEGPQVAPDAMSVPAYASAPTAQTLPIGAYVGIPIRWEGGELFGVLCGLDPAIQAPDLTAHEPLLNLLGGLLSMILAADHARTQAAREMERVELLADTDPLTGLFNRRAWTRFLQLEEARYQRFGDPGAVVVVDLDRLKHVNDTYGHAAGDTYIKDAAKALTSVVRGRDLLARLGGDEFGVIAAGAGPAATEALMARIAEAFDAVGVAGSIGAAPYAVAGGFPDAWEKADAAMYTAKQSRRGAAA